MSTIGMIDDPNAVMEGRLPLERKIQENSANSTNSTNSTNITNIIKSRFTTFTRYIGTGIISQLVVSLLFIYFIISGNGLLGLLSCEFQKLIIHNGYFKHLILFLTIYIIVFILATYSNNAILQGKIQFSNITGQYVETFLNKLENKSKRPSALQILLTYLFYTMIIYMIFLATTKCEIEYLIVFFILILIHFGIILIELYNPDNIEGKLETPDTIILYLAFFVLIIGFGMYTFRQMDEHSGEWSYIRFLFGEPKCVEVH
jgi:hypothetical protein